MPILSNTSVVDIIHYLQAKRAGEVMCNLGQVNLSFTNSCLKNCRIARLLLTKLGWATEYRMYHIGKCMSPLKSYVDLIVIF